MSDPLDGAAVGETRTVTRSKTVDTFDMEPREFWGSDRQRDVEIADVEIVTNERDGLDDIRVTWEAEVTKRLPRRWDECDEPRTAAERRSERRSKWLGRVGQAVGFVFSIAFVSTVAAIITRWTFDGSATINGQPLTAPSVPTMAGMLILVICLAGVFIWAAHQVPQMGGVTR